ncbi:hypothetical protein JTF06_10825 [Desemzia sp. RIT804]|uniref:hypothetical protein n=1 Tax=Desemzia sp. RIT 804 TaxID=2810209 RepID=UPI00194FEBF5|nr:hypothetical protein [Desemzia sp. RIT 804]MBM6615382.1 hypothetical protein [Desemzia sp. RIT 804]
METEDNLEKSEHDSAKKYSYVVKAKDKIVHLKVDNADVLINADGEIDCPLDGVLRKNGYSIYDLLSWNTKEIDFIVLTNNVEQLIRTIPLNISLEAT